MQPSLALGTEVRGSRGGGSRWQYKVHLLSGTDPGSCWVALEFPDPQIKTMMRSCCCCIQTFLFQKAKVVSVSCSPPCLSSFRTPSPNTHLMWLVWNLAFPTVTQRPRLGLPPCTCHLALPLAGQTSCSNPCQGCSLHPSILGRLGLATPL